MNYYDILGIKRDATISDIKTAYKALIRKWHPDKNPNNDNAVTMTSNINEAYTILADSQKRHEYDELGYDGMKDKQQYEAAAEQDNDNTDAPSIIVELEVTLEELYDGCHKQITIERYDICKSCNQSVCHSCNGTGFVSMLNVYNNITDEQYKPCDICNGSGKSICIICDGRQLIPNKYEFTHNILPGASSLEPIEIENIGNQHANKSGRSSVHIVIIELPHNIYMRHFTISKTGYKSEPADLFMTINISLPESICGFQREITLLNNTVANIDYRDIIQPDDIIKLYDCGMPVYNKHKHGALYVQFKVIYPNDISHEIRTRIWQLLTKSSYQRRKQLDRNVVIEKV